MIYSVIILFIEECDLFWSEDVTPAELIEVDEDCLPGAATDAGPPRHGQTGPLAPASFPLGPLPAQHSTHKYYILTPSCSHSKAEEYIQLFKLHSDNVVYK